MELSISWQEWKERTGPIGLEDWQVLAAADCLAFGNDGIYLIHRKDESSAYGSVLYSL